MTGQYEKVSRHDYSNVSIIKEQYDVCMCMHTMYHEMLVCIQYNKMYPTQAQTEFRAEGPHYHAIVVPTMVITTQYRYIM